MHSYWISLVAAFFAGLLAGEELVICLGVRGPISRLDQRGHIQVRQALIGTLKILVPIMFGCAFVSGTASAIAAGDVGSGSYQWTSVVCLIVFMAVTLAGTVPINKAAARWDADSPPEGWQEQVRSWERLDNIRTGLAVVAFITSLAGIG
jgi:uncharacterized membrane protein